MMPLQSGVENVGDRNDQTTDGTSNVKITVMLRSVPRWTLQARGQRWMKRAVISRKLWNSSSNMRQQRKSGSDYMMRLRLVKLKVLAMI